MNSADLHSDASNAVAEAAFQRAKQFHQATFEHKKAESWLSESSTISDVLRILETSHHRYEAKKSSRSKVVTYAGSWWKIAASRISHYGQVVDTFVSSNPEYAALVWGALRFLLQVCTQLDMILDRISAHNIAPSGDAESRRIVVQDSSGAGGDRICAARGRLHSFQAISNRKDQRHAGPSIRPDHRVLHTSDKMV